MEDQGDPIQTKRRRRSDLIERSGLVKIVSNSVAPIQEVPSPTTNTQVSRSTLSSTSTHVKRFREYLRSEKQPTNFEEQGNVWLNEWLGNFYAEVLSYNGKPYSQKTLACMRASLHRYLDATGRVNKHDLTSGADFRDANLVLVGRRRELQHQEAAAVKSHHPIVECDMAILRAYFRGRSSNPLILMEAAAFYLLYYFSCCGCDLLGKLRVDSLIFSVDEHGRHFVTLRQVTNNKACCYEDLLNKEDCPYCIIRDYVAALPPGVPRLFMHAMDSFIFNEKCQKMIGFKGDFGCSGRYLSELLSRLSGKLNLSRRYTNHCVRSTVLQIFRTRAASQTGEMIDSALRNYGNQLPSDVAINDKEVEVEDKTPPASSSSSEKDNHDCNVAPIDLSNPSVKFDGSETKLATERPSVIFANLTLNLTLVKQK